jgi:hypothetical protein
MRISHVHIENFRNFHELDVAIGEHAVIVMGHRNLPLKLPEGLRKAPDLAVVLRGSLPCSSLVNEGTEIKHSLDGLSQIRLLKYEPRLIDYQQISAMRSDCQPPHESFPEGGFCGCNPKSRSKR